MVKGTDPTKLKYKLTNIELEYEMIRSEELANDATSAYTGGKGFLYDHVSRFIVKPIDKTRPLINIKVHAQRRSIKGILLLFVEPYAAGERDSEKLIFPDLNKVSVTINGSPNMLYNNGIEIRDAWRQVSRFFLKEKHKPQHMTLQKFLTENKVWASDRSALYGHSRNEWQRHPPRQHHRWRPGGNRERHQRIRNC